MYAGNLSWTTTDEQLLAFANTERGAISAEIKRHKDTKRSKGWGWETMNHLHMFVIVSFDFALTN